MAIWPAPCPCSSAPLRSTRSSRWRTRRSGFTYGLMGQPALSAESNRRAYELRDRASDREKFFITASYDMQVTGNLEKAQQTCELWARTYPRDIQPHALLGAFVYPTFGKYEKGVAGRPKTDRARSGLSRRLSSACVQQSVSRAVWTKPRMRSQRAADRKLEIPELLGPAIRHRLPEGRSRPEWNAKRLGFEANPAPEDLIADREGFVLAYSGHLEQATTDVAACGGLGSAGGPAGKGGSVSRPAPRCGTPFSEMPPRPGRARRPHWSFQRTAMWSMAPPSPWLSRENLPARKHSPTIWNGDSRRTRQSDSFTCRRFARFSH